jgi:hypothetical protein
LLMRPAIALLAMTLSNGCSQPSSKTSSAAKEKPIGDSYQSGRPSPFVGKILQTGGNCFIDSFNGQRTAPRNEVPGSGSLTVDGWAIDATRAAAPYVAIELAPLPAGQSYYAPAQHATRPGLGAALKNPELDRAGLVSTASLSSVPVGSYSIKVLTGSDTSATRCDPNLLLVVK